LLVLLADRWRWRGISRGLRAEKDWRLYVVIGAFGWMLASTKEARGGEVGIFANIADVGEKIGVRVRIDSEPLTATSSALRLSSLSAWAQWQRSGRA